MKVKIHGLVVDSDDTPIMIILTPGEKQLISDMGEQTKFCVFPEGMLIPNIESFMKGELPCETNANPVCFLTLL